MTNFQATTPAHLPVSYGDIEAAARRLSGRANPTPIMTSATVDRLTQARVFFKCENFQRTGSFKFRGAYNAIAQLSPEQKQAGVLAYSSGNHAQAIALAGRLFDIKTAIAMPEDAPSVKKTATRDYGAEIIFYKRQETTREKLLEKLVTKRDCTVIHPFDNQQVIAGQGTAAKELIEEVGELDLLLVGCGGGGLLSGSAIAASALTPECRIIGVEPERADDATRSFYSKTLQSVHNPDTIADGARTPSLGQFTFPLVLHYVRDMVTVSEEAILNAMFFLWERLKIVAEPTGALATAALLEGAVPAPDARIGVIVTGGNVDIRELSK